MLSRNIDEILEEIRQKLRQLTGQEHVLLTSRGNEAIRAAVSVVGGSLLIPDEGGWLEYRKCKDVEYVRCTEAVIDVADLQKKLASAKFKGLLYANPGGYFAQQPLQKMYDLCQKSKCLVILDVSGSLGTAGCDGRYADILVGSFGKWKPVDAEVGGFISSKEKKLFQKILQLQPEFTDPAALQKIQVKLVVLPQRISFLQKKVQKIKDDLNEFDVVHREDQALVVLVRFKETLEKEKIINYCKSQGLEWEECPRYIRLNEPAISIEVKRLSHG